MKTTALILAMLILIMLFCLAISFDARADDGIGKIEIPSINCKFDLSYSGKDLDAHQHIALLFKEGGAVCVGNHYGSHSEKGGQWKLQNVKLGDKAYLEYITMDGLETVHHKGKYICYAMMICDVVDFDFYHNGIEVKPYDSTDLICCTCVGSDSTRNYVCFFERVE